MVLRMDALGICVRKMGQDMNRKNFCNNNSCDDVLDNCNGHGFLGDVCGYVCADLRGVILQVYKKTPALTLIKLKFLFSFSPQLLHEFKRDKNKKVH